MEKRKLYINTGLSPIFKKLKPSSDSTEGTNPIDGFGNIEPGEEGIEKFLQGFILGATMDHHENDSSLILTTDLMDPNTGAVREFCPEIAMEIDKQTVKTFFSPKTPEFLSTRQWDRQESLGSKKFILIDLSGTLHIEDTPTPNAIDSLEFLRTAGFKLLFVTNTTKESKRVLYERLVRIGFNIRQDEIFTSLCASRAYVEKNGLRPFLMVADEALEDFKGLNVENPNAVLVGLSAKSFSHDCMSQAFRLLMKEETKLLAIHKGRSYRTSTGISLGPGPFVIALECSSDKSAIIMGKPDESFFKSALNWIGCDNYSEAVMIGDDITDDVFGAMKVGVTGILVQTGKYSSHDESMIRPHLPDFKVANFSQAVELLIETTAKGLELRPNMSTRVLAESISIKLRSSDT